MVTKIPRQALRSPSHFTDQPVGLRERYGLPENLALVHIRRLVQTMMRLIVRTLGVGNPTATRDKEQAWRPICHWQSRTISLPVRRTSHVEIHGLIHLARRRSSPPRDARATRMPSLTRGRRARALEEVWREKEFWLVRSGALNDGATKSAAAGG